MRVPCAGIALGRCSYQSLGWPVIVYEAAVVLVFFFSRFDFIEHCGRAIIAAELEGLETVLDSPR